MEHTFKLKVRKLQERCQISRVSQKLARIFSCYVFQLFSASMQFENFTSFLVPHPAIIGHSIHKKLGLSSRSRELLACQKFMTILMGHKAACVAKQHMQLRKSAVDFSQLLTVEVEGCLNFSDFCTSWT